MGNSKSAAKADTQRKILLAMPSWCIDSFVVSSETVDHASASWRFAMSGESPPFQAAKKKEPSLTPLVFFYNQFYYFLFELLPDVRPMFSKGMKAQGRMLANVIKYIITNLKEADESILKHSLEHLARVHNQRGITAEQYSVMGMVLVHTVRICTGATFWTDKHKDAWVHIYSKMMSIIIPVVISNEVPIGMDDDGDMAAQLAYYKKGNLNAEADDPSKNSKNSKSVSPPKVPAVTQSGGGSGSVAGEKTPGPFPAGSTCPALEKPHPEDEQELSHTLKEHFRENAEQHLSVLDQEARARQAEEEEQKYLILSRVLTIAHRVETHIRESGGLHAPDGRLLPHGCITGHKLLRLLQSHNWVSDVAGARTACAYFLSLNLMTRLDGQAPSRQQTTLQPNGEEASTPYGPNHFPDDNTQYSFCMVVGSSITPPQSPTPHVDLIAVDRRSSASKSDSFHPHCYVNDIKPGSILNALSPSPVPNLADVRE